MRQRQTAKRKAAAPARAGFDLVAHRRWVLIGILAVGAVLRLCQIGSVPAGLNHDVAMNGNNALENLEKNRMALYYPENTGREGLFINVQTVSVAIFGNTAFALRLPAAIFGLLTIWAVYCLGAEWFSARVGLVAAFFTATSFWHVLFSRAGLRAISAPCFLVWSLYFVLAGMRRRHVGGLVLAGAIYGLGFDTYIAYRVTPLLVGGVLVYEGWRTRNWKGVAAFSGAAAVLFAPLAAYFLTHAGSFGQRTAGLSVFGTAHPATELLTNSWKTLGMFFWEGDPNWGHNFGSRPELFWPVAILFAVGVIVAAMRRSAPGVVLLGWLAVGVVPAVLSHDTMPHALRSILVIPAVFLLAGLGAEAIFDRVGSRALNTAIAVILGVVLAVEPYHVYFDLWSTNPEVAKWSNAALAGIAEQINAMPAETPKYLAMNVAAGLEHDMPIQAATVMFLTRSYTPQQQKRINMHYVSPRNFRGPAGVDFCEAVSRAAPAGAALICVQ